MLRLVRYQRFVAVFVQTAMHKEGAISLPYFQDGPIISRVIPSQSFYRSSCGSLNCDARGPSVARVGLREGATCIIR